MMRLASVFFGLLACALSGLGVYQYATDRYGTDVEPPPGAALTADEPVRELGSLARASEMPLRFRVKNHSAQPVRVVGISEG